MFVALRHKSRIDPQGKGKQGRSLQFRKQRRLVLEVVQVHPERLAEVQKAKRRKVYLYQKLKRWKAVL